MKKLISIFLVLAMIFAVLPFGSITAFAATSGTTGDCTWTLEGTTLTISGRGKMGDCGFTTPWGTSITNVVIEEGVENIGQYAFSGCNSLENINIPNSVENIGEGAFFLCDSLKKINIPSAVKNIGSSSFYGCNLLEQVYIYDMAAWISIDFGSPEANPMYYAEKLYLNDKIVTDIVLPMDVTKIGDYAFFAYDITSITIPKDVSIIGKYTFYGCDLLTSITVDKDNNYFASEKDVLFNKSMNSLILYPCAKKDLVYSIPNNVTRIEDFAFSCCRSLTDITIPNSVTKIGDYAFEYCVSLKNINIPNSVKSIGWSAFADCSSITEIYIPDSVISIDCFAFYGCESLSRVVMLDSVTYIGTGAFINCESVTDIILSKSVTEISREMFLGCSSLTSVYIPDNVKSIDVRAFLGCDSLSNVYYHGIEAEWNAISIGYENTSLTDADIHFKGTPKANDLVHLRDLIFEGEEMLFFDYTGNCEVDARDLVRLKKYLAGADVSLDN